MTTSATIARTTINEFMQISGGRWTTRRPSRGLAHFQREAVDFDDLGLVTGPDCDVAGITRAPARTAVVDAAGLAGRQRHGQSQAIALVQALVDLTAGPAQQPVEAPPERQHR